MPLRIAVEDCVNGFGTGSLPNENDTLETLLNRVRGTTLDVFTRADKVLCNCCALQCYCDREDVFGSAMISQPGSQPLR